MLNWFGRSAPFAPCTKAARRVRVFYDPDSVLIRKEPRKLELAFASKSLRTSCENECQATLEFNARLAEMLKHRLADLRAATSPRDLVTGRPRIVRDAGGEYMMIDLAEDYRLAFTANHTKNPVAESNDIDWAKVTRIKILWIERANA